MHLNTTLTRAGAGATAFLARLAISQLYKTLVACFQRLVFLHNPSNIPSDPQISSLNTYTSIGIMSVVSLLGVKVLNNPAPFTSSYEFEITFECLESLKEGESSRELSSSASALTTIRFRVEAHICWICNLC